MSKNVLILNNLSDGFFDKGVKESLKVQYKLGLSISEVRANNQSLPVIFITDSGLAGNFRLDVADTITLDDGANVLVSLNNKRYKRVEGFTPRKEHFINLVPGTNSVVLQFKPYDLNQLVVTRNGFTANDYGINNKTITFLTAFGNSPGAVGAEEVLVTFFS
jgi:hypothetical protein